MLAKKWEKWELSTIDALKKRKNYRFIAEIFREEDTPRTKHKDRKTMTFDVSMIYPQGESSHPDHEIKGLVEMKFTKARVRAVSDGFDGMTEVQLEFTIPIEKAPFWENNRRFTVNLGGHER